MSSSNSSRDRTPNLQGFLNDLQDWELNFKDNKTKMPQPQPQPQPKPSKTGLVNEVKRSVEKKGPNILSNTTSKHRAAMNYDPLSDIPTSFKTDQSAVDAASEKDLGNEFFKQKKYNDAIDCYSRSIALSPTAVGYANRAMAYLKIKRYREAEEDCTEALNLDDRYIKAYSRRATARKEIGTLRDSLEDVEFGLRLEPQNEELKKQRAEVKSLLEKAILAKAAGTTTRSPPSVEEIKPKVHPSKDKKGVQTITNGIKKAVLTELTDSAQASGTSKSFDNGNTPKQQANGGPEGAPNTSHTTSTKIKKDLPMSVQELASRAASRAVAEAAKNITTPNSAYQFEVSWRGFCGDRALQCRLLKVTPPDGLPQIFKNALTASLLIDIIKCIASIFTEETDLAVKYLQNLTKVPRFDMIIMCLPSADKADLCRTWNEVFLGKATPIEYAELLSKLHPRYCPF